MSISPGSRFGSCEIVDPLGAGGMGEVYRARDTNLKRDVAIKVLPGAFVADADRLARFRREAEMLASLNHPNIAQVFGLEQAGGQTAIVMELVEGPTLADRIKQGPIAPDEAMAIALQVVAALEAAHDKQIVHRDLKPANVKVREDGTVKVLDFGISKPIDPAAISGGAPVATTPAMTQTGVILGTAAYMSPEQARGKLVDERTDIWAFGCLLFEMLTGQPAFGGEDVMLTLARVLDRDTDLSSIPKTISPAVRHTIELCLQKDPRRRIADIRDVRLALEGKFESDLPRVEAEASARPLWRRALVPAGALAAGVAIAALAAVVIRPEAPAPRVSRQVQFVSADLMPALVTAVPVLAVAPDGSEFSYASTAGLVRRSLSELDSRLIPGTSSVDSIAPHYSQDGRSLFYGAMLGNGRSGPLKRIASEGGTPQQILPTFPGNGWWPASGADLYAVMSDDDCIVARIPAAGGEPVTIFEDTGLWCFEPILLPDGEHLLTYGQRKPGVEDYRIMVHSLETQQTRILFPGLQPTLVDSRWLVYFEPPLGLSVRAFDPARAMSPDTEPFGRSVLLIDDVMTNNQGILGHYRVSAGGETLVYLRSTPTGNSEGALATLRPDGGLERLAFAAGNFAFPAVSPDGTRLALTRRGDSTLDGEVWIYDLSGRTEPRQLTFDSTSALATWTPDGEELAYIRVESDRRFGIWQQDADGRRPAEALIEVAAGAVPVLFPAYAPDGRLGFAQPNGADDLDLFIAPVPGGQAELLRGGPGVQIGLDFSADGKAYAYQSNSDIFVARYPPDGSAVLRVAGPLNLAAWPVWSGDSARLAYQSNSQEITIVEIDTETLAVRGRRTITVPLRKGDTVRLIDAVPSSDNWLVIVDPGSGRGGRVPGSEIVVVENWIAEIEARVPPL